MLKITINTENQAFENGNLHDELARILAECVQTLEKEQNYSKLYDINGNPVGELTIKER